LKGPSVATDCACMNSPAASTEMKLFRKRTV
jgi:hypothetical protein